MARPDAIREPAAARPGGALLALLLSGAGQTAVAGNWTVQPGLQWQETWSDNVTLAAPGSERRDLVSQLTPALRLSGEGGRLKASMDASWQMLNYANGTSGSRTNPMLNARGTLELVDKWLYVEGLASVSQQAVSAFGPQTAQAANVNGNVGRVSNYSISPYVHGLVGSDLIYDLRLQQSQTSTASTTTTAVSNAGTNGRTTIWSGGLRWGNSARLFNVAANFTSTSSTYSGSQSATAGTTGTLYGYFNPDAHLSLYVDIGRERSTAAGGATLLGSSNASGPSRGLGLQWQPDARTSLAAHRDWRYFGPSDSFSLSHRFRRSALSLAYTKDRITSQGLLAHSLGGNYYELYSNMLSAAFPDLVQRDLAVRQLLNAQGLSPTAVPVLGFLSDNIMIQRALNISYAITGVRNTLTILAARSDSRTDTLVSLADFLSSYTSVGQRSLSLNWAFQVSPYSTLTTTLMQSRSDGIATNGIATYTRQSSVNLLWNTQLTPHAAGSLGLRHVNASGSASGTGTYKENAATATLGYKY